MAFKRQARIFDVVKTLAWIASATFLFFNALNTLYFTSVPTYARSNPDWEKELAKGNQQLSLGNKEKAADMFAKKVQKFPNSGACHTALGRAYKRLGKIDEAKREFKTATQVEPTYADGFYEYGSSLESDQQWAEAAQAFNTYLSLNPDASKRKLIEDRIRFCQDKQQH